MISILFDHLSDYLANRKGLIPIIGHVLIVCNLVIQFILPDSISANSNLLLHIGLIAAIFGLMMAWAL